MASVSQDNTVRVWRASDGLLLYVLAGHTNQTSVIAFSPDGTFLATGGGCLDGYVKLWRSSDGALIRSFEACTNGVTALVFSPDMSRLVVAGDRDEQVIKFWTLDGIQ